MNSRFPGTASPQLAAAVAAALAAALSVNTAAQSSEALETVTVTATRRAQSVQDVPLNIAAVSSDVIRAQGIGDLAELSRAVPGLFVLDQGPRGPNSIIVRGLNATSVSGTEGLGNSGGGKVATYVGEIPVYVDLRPEDLERVEVLLGPQGTLYGAGTLGGAIRYIPQRPKFDTTSLSVRADAYALAHSDGLGGRGGFTFNAPLGERLAVRASLDYHEDPGFIDANYLVREPGVSNPQPDFSDRTAVRANLRRQQDVDDEKTWSGRAALRWQVTDAIDANLTYYFQDQHVGGRTGNHRASFGTGHYESAARFLEPNARKNEILALEATADLGFAELTSATAYSEFSESGRRDQTDFLMTLGYGYELFPTFAAYTLDEQEDERFNQELRLVSSHAGPLRWIVGAFYNKYTYFNTSTEFTPRFGDYIGLPGTDDIEYDGQLNVEQVEKALYGEVSYDLTERWQITLGARYYDYKFETVNLIALPYIGVESAGGSGQEDDGALFKFNTSYKFSDAAMAYFTVSEGFRLGNSNGLALCDPAAGINNSCAQPHEYAYFPDTTLNYELGLRSQWWNQRLTLNAAVFYVDWNDPQLASSTQADAIPITVNGKGAMSRGIELTFDALLTDSLRVYGGYSYVQAELTEYAPALLRGIRTPGFSGFYVDGQDGDRLPGSPEHQGHIAATYSIPVGVNQLSFTYGVAAISDVLTRTAGLAGGEALPGFALHSAAVTYDTDRWGLTLYAKNLFDKYAETGVRSTRDYVQNVTDENGADIALRLYGKDIVRPREVGLRLTYNFGD